MSTSISLPLHPKWGKPSETYIYERGDGMRCIQAKYRNGADGPKQCAWWVQGTDGEYYVSHGDVKLERLKPYTRRSWKTRMPATSRSSSAKVPRTLTPSSAWGLSRRITAPSSPPTSSGIAAATW